MEIAVGLIGGISSGARSMRACLLLLALFSIQYSASEGTAGLQAAGYHPADEKLWHDISPLSDGDVHMLAGQAKEYAEMGKKMQDLDDATLERERKTRERLAKEKDEEMSKPAHDPETMSVQMAKLQQKLAFTLSRLDDCHAQLRTCLSNADIKATGKSESAHHQAPEVRLGEDKHEVSTGEDNEQDSEDESEKAGEAEEPTKRIDFPKTTAQEDWDYEYHNKEPYPHPWRQKRGAPIEQEKQTAKEEYDEAQKGMTAFDHEPGYKFPQDRLFPETIHKMAAEGNQTRLEAQAQLDQDYARANKTMIAADAKAAEATIDVEKAEKQVTASNALRLPSEEEKAIGNAKANLAKCQMDVHKCENK